jgi:lipopolysaccharide export system protein LptA
MTLVLLFTALPALAQGQGQVKVTADNFVVDQGAALATFTGSVVVVRSDLTVWADKVEVEYADNSLSTIRNMIATGKVRLKTETQEATGNRAVFDPRTQILRLTGNVQVVNASGIVNGPELLVNLANDTSTFTSSGGGRVTGVFTPND